MNTLFASSCICVVVASACGGAIAGPDDAGSPGPGQDANSTDVTATDASGGTDASGTDASVGGSGKLPCSNNGGECGPGLTCCNNACTNEYNDPLNCGGCGIQCTGATSECNFRQCSIPQCSPACATGQVCCDILCAGPSGVPTCETGNTCPNGCP